MIASNAPFEEDDSINALSLMQEYTDKLVDVTQAFNSRTTTLIWGGSLGAVIPLLVVTYLGLRYPDLNLKNNFNPALLPGLLAGIIFTLIFLVISLRTSLRRDYFIRAHQIAEILRRLISSVSQYREHSPRRFRRTFEFDLRIVEAETALRFYENSIRSLLIVLLYGRWKSTDT